MNAWNGITACTLFLEYGTLEDTENQASNPSGTDGQRDGSKGPRFELDNYGSRLTYPTFRFWTSSSRIKQMRLTVLNFNSNSILRMSKAGALQTEPFTLGGVGLVDRKKAAAFCKDYHATLLQVSIFVPCQGIYDVS
jgi:hypothetical protein